MSPRGRSAQTRQRYLTAVVARADGSIIDLPGYGAAGMSGAAVAPLVLSESTAIPSGSELMHLPHRRPVVIDLATERPMVLERDPLPPHGPIFPVAAFTSPGYVLRHTCAFEAERNAAPLPLFAYGAVGWGSGGFRTAVVRVDTEPRQDLRRMSQTKVRAGIARMQRQMPDNRLRAHLEHCALVYGCPAGKNFFLGRYEAPLPTATTCNARCLGCLSLQTGSDIPCSQHRIAFEPSAEEIAEVALAHIARTPRAVVSFGQGCEGDPLMAADTIGRAIALIRRSTDAGTINMNTNGSLPDRLAALCDAGLDSVRISINSFRPEAYHAYFRPRGYAFDDVMAGLRLMAGRGKFVSINYLNSPGITDCPEEWEAFSAVLNEGKIRFIQWRNLNFDPRRYYRLIGDAASLGPPIGMTTLIARVREQFPKVGHGYFNPPKEKWGGFITKS